MKIAYLDCFSGISGDMLLGALADAGVPFDVLEAAVASLGLDARLKLKRVDRSGIDAAKVDVVTAEGKLADGGHAHVHEHVHEDGHGHEANHVHGRSLTEIQRLIRASNLPTGVQSTALKAFQLLGDAEAKIHNVPVDEIHFHEVGAVDAIADIVAASAGCHWLKTHEQVERWLCSPLNVGGGHVHCAHGKFPVPAPATLELLCELPVYSSGVQKELVTPTGAALLRALEVTAAPAFPAMRMSATGYGAGSRDLAGQPNVLRLVVGESTKIVKAAHQVQNESRVGVIETTIDDATPELLSYVADLLLAAGAADVWRTPVQMKKGRVGTQLTILCEPEKAETLQAMVFAETTTLGLRYHEETKIVLEREFVSVATEWGEVRIKIGVRDDGERVNAAPEFEDCRLIAEGYRVPLKQVMQAAMAVYLQQEQPAQEARA